MASSFRYVKLDKFGIVRDPDRGELRAATAEIIRKKIECASEDRFWTLADFSSLPAPAVSKTLSRLARDGILNRVRKGVYYCSRKTRFGYTKPDPIRLVAALLEHKKIAAVPTGLAVWNALGLTAQVSAVTTFAVDRRVSMKTPNSRVRLQLVPSLQSLSSEERAALDAMRNLSQIPDAAPVEIIKRLVELCRIERLSFDRLSAAGLSDSPRVRALLGLIGTLLGEKKSTLEKLHRSLNPTTAFKLGLSTAFPVAKSWQIR